MAFSGAFEVVVERNNRVKLPIPLQQGLGQRFYVSGLQVWNFLVLYPEPNFIRMMEQLEEGVSPLDPVFMHVLPQLGASSFEVIMDDRGRFTVPARFQEFISRSVLLVGAGRTVRLYKTEIWKRINQENSALQILATRLAAGGA